MALSITTSPDRQTELVDYIQELSLARALEDVTEIVRRAARRLARADGATFILRDGDQCHYVSEDAIGPLWSGLRFPMSACVSGFAMIHGQTVSIPDIYKDPRVPITAYRPTFVRSLLMTPIRKTKPLGAVGVYWATLHQASEFEMRLLSSLTNATAVALRNVELEDALNDRINQLETAAKSKDKLISDLLRQREVRRGS